jgi:hypothetical protein
MIAISTNIFDLNGTRIFPQKTNENLRWSRRVSRTATLDGGVSIYDTGYAPGDRDIIVRVREASREVADWMAYILKTYNKIIVSTVESVFEGVPAESYVDYDGAAVMTINITKDIGG